MGYDTKIQEFSDFDIEIPPGRLSGQVYTKCPRCSADRKKKNAKPLSVNLDNKIWNCHHCSWKGSLNPKQSKILDPIEWTNETALPPHVVEWFLKRNISQNTLIKMGIGHGKHFMPQTGKEEEVIMFPYFRNGERVNTKYRTLEKQFAFDKGKEIILYNIDSIIGQSTVVIVEGEIDALTLIDQGYPCVISVPRGANSGNNNLSYLNLEDFQDKNKIFITTDNDEPGNKLAKDLADFFGPERCFRWLPGSYKDPNEMLCKTGKLSFSEEPFIESIPFFKDYILTEEPEHEESILCVNGVGVLSKGNVMTIFGPPKSMKTRLAKYFVNAFKLKTGFVDSEQGRKHAWLTGKAMQTADLFHMRGQGQTEIQRVAWEIANSGEYELLVLDNIRDAACLDFNDTIQAAALELFLKKISLQIPVICVAHQNKNSQSISGHMGNALEKISQTIIRCQLADIENPSAGSTVSCQYARDEPFKPALLTVEGHLTNESMLRSAGKSMLLNDVLRIIGGKEYSRVELNEAYAEIFNITPRTAANEISKLKKLHPGVITERKEGKTKFFNVSLHVE